MSHRTVCQEFSRSIPAISTLVTCLMLSSATADEGRQTYHWDGNGSSPYNGIFQVPENWDPDEVPGPDDDAVFTIPEDYTVQFNGDAHTWEAVMVVGDPDDTHVTWLPGLAYPGSTYTIHLLNVGYGELTIDSLDVYVPDDPGYPYECAVSGIDGTARLKIINGGQLTCDGMVSISEWGSWNEGDVEVSGSGSVLDAEEVKLGTGSPWSNLGNLEILDGADFYSYYTLVKHGSFRVAGLGSVGHVYSLALDKEEGFCLVEIYADGTLLVDYKIIICAGDFYVASGGYVHVYDRIELGCDDCEEAELIMFEDSHVIVDGKLHLYDTHPDNYIGCYSCTLQADTIDLDLARFDIRSDFESDVGGTILVNHIEGPFPWDSDEIDYVTIGHTFTLGGGDVWIPTTNIREELCVGLDADAVVPLLGTLSADRVVLGKEPDGDGTLLIPSQGQHLVVAENLTVGLLGHGAIEGQPGRTDGEARDGETIVCQSAFVAAEPGSSGEVTLDAGYSWAIGDNLYVGGDATAAGGTGHVEIRGVPSKLSVGDTCKVWGTGSLTIGTGATLEADTLALTAIAALSEEPGAFVRINALSGLGPDVTMGGHLDLGHPGGSGQADVTIGAGTGLSIGQNFGVGSAAPATLTVTDGGSLAAGSAMIWAQGSLLIDNDGTFDGGDSLSIQESGSIDVQSGDLWVHQISLWGDANFSTGAGSTLRFNELSGFDAALSFPGNLELGWVTGDYSESSFTFDGPTTGLEVGGTLTVGYDGLGTLTALNGGQISSGTGYLGREAGGAGTIALSGADTAWNAAGVVYVGSGIGAAGTLEVAEGANVTAQWLKIGYDGMGDVTVTGNGSSITTASYFVVGDHVEGVGTLSITDGATFECAYGYLGYAAGSTFDVTVDGGYSTAALNSVGGLRIGRSGSGTLSILRDGGQVTAADLVIVGQYASSNATVSVDAGGMFDCSNAELRIGDAGIGELDVGISGQVLSNGCSIASQGTAAGAVTLGGTWQDSASVYVGGDADGPGGTATLELDTGWAQLTIADTLKVWNTGTVQLDTGSDAGVLEVDTLDLTEAGTFLTGQARLRVNTVLGSLQTYGPLEVGLDVGTLHVTGNTLQILSELVVEIAGNQPGEADVLTADGAVNITYGQLTLQLLDGYEPEYDDTFVILSGASLTGTFTNAAAHAYAEGGGRFEVEYTDTAVILTHYTTSCHEWILRSETGPSPRKYHVMAYDEARDMVVLFGGRAGDPPDYLGDTWEWDGQTWSLRSTSGPAARQQATMCYDTGREVVVLFGGSASGSPMGDTWEWDGDTWTLQASGGPAPRYGATLAQDTARGVCTLFGGTLASGSSTDDTWEWDGSTWTQRFPDTSPPPRSSAVMVYDATRGVIVLDRGYGYNVPGDPWRVDTWEWDGTDWDLRAEQVPPGTLMNSAMVYDASREMVLRHGGFDLFDEVWAWDGAVWTRVNPQTTVPGRHGHAMVFDRRRDEMVMFGGQIGTGSSDVDGSTWTLAADPRILQHPNPTTEFIGRTAELGVEAHGVAGELTYQWRKDGAPVTDGGTISGATTDTLIIDLVHPDDEGSYDVVVNNECDEAHSIAVPFTVDCVDWRLADSGTGPEARSWAEMVYDRAREANLLFGGNAGAVFFGDTWKWDGSTWTLVATEGPSPRVFHSMAYDSVRDVAVLFGGSEESGDLGDTWEWDGTVWTLRSTGGPTARHLQVMAFDEQRGVVVLFGGKDGATESGETWEWDGSTWALRATTGPDPRRSQCMAYDAEHGMTVLFGGMSYDGSYTYYDDTWLWDGTVWTLAATSGPPALELAAMVYDSARGRVVLFGGSDADGTNLSGTWEWDGGVNTWTRLSNRGPAGRTTRAITYDRLRDAVVLFGGYDGDTVLADTWEMVRAPYLYGAPTDLSVPLEETAQISVQVDPLAGVVEYLWHHDSTPLSDDGHFAGTQTDTLTISLASLADAGAYQVLVTHACSTAMSVPALLTVEFEDCNENDLPDEQDLTGGTSQDCNANGVPDECELGRELTARWRLDESSGTTAEEEISGHDGTLVNYADGDPRWTAGVAGNALTFDGVNDHITHDFSVGTRGTLSHWLRPDQNRAMVAYYESDGPRNGFGDVSGLEIHSSLKSDGSPHFIYQDGTSVVQVVGVPGLVGEWTHVGVTWDTTGDLILYVDGLEAAREPMADLTFENRTSTHRFIGRVGSGQTNRHWVGLMDDVQVYNVVLTPDEIAHLAAGPGFAYGSDLTNDCNSNGVPDACDLEDETSIDCNGNWIPDECDTMEGGDFDADGDVDLDDYAALADCLAGPDEVPSPSATECVDACLATFDANADNDVDFTDFAEFQEAFTGSAP